MKSLIDRISEDLHLNDAYIDSIVDHSFYYYKDYRIPKKDNGWREISQASPELKSLQYWVKENILTLLPVSKCAFAYKRGDSVKRHATFHKESNYIFHTDIKDFFTNIHAEQLTNVLKHHNIALEKAGLWYEDICDVLSKICFRLDKLCIGTVSSPSISNIIMYDFDEYFNAYCTENRYRYSRYADDIYISSYTYLPESIKYEVKNKLREKGFVINSTKTWFKSKKSRRQITGLVLTENGRVSVGSEMRGNIKKMIYDRIVNGTGNPEVILGYLAFLQDVEPNVYNRYLIKYAAYCSGDVIDAIKSGPINAQCSHELKTHDFVLTG